MLKTGCCLIFFGKTNQGSFMNITNLFVLIEFDEFLCNNIQVL